MTLPGGEVLEAAGTLAPIEEVGVGDVRAEGGGDVGGAGAGVLGGLEDVDSVRLGEGERVQEDGIDEREDCGGGTDAEGQGKDRHRGERLALAELSECEAEVLEDGAHCRFSCASVWLR